MIRVDLSGMDLGDTVSSREKGGSGPHGYFVSHLFYHGAIKRFRHSGMAP